MPNRLADSVSPYLRSHSDNPVDWYPWGAEAFAEAARRDVPVLISIGYATCHWCHVMARESFSDPALAAWMNENFVSIKVDREEHPDVDSSYLAAASAFTDQLGWPLTVFATPAGRAFYAGTYFPPVAMLERPSFRQVLDAILDAWTQRRAEVESNAEQLAAAIRAQALDAGAPRAARSSDANSMHANPMHADPDASPMHANPDANLLDAVPTEADFSAVLSELAGYEDREFGGFGGAPKFPVAPTVNFLLDSGSAEGIALATRTLSAMAASDLRDQLEGGFFRYATRRDWSEPHYERMLYDNAQLLDAYARVDSAAVATGIADFLLAVLRLPSGGFASAQDSESTINGQRVEGGYYALDAAARAAQVPPALDDKVLTGWNGLAIGALASAGSRLGRPDWVDAAARAAELVATPASGTLVRARIGNRISTARPTLEDYGMLASGLIELALAAGEPRWAIRARELIRACMTAGADGAGGAPRPFAVPGGPDPVLAAHGLALDADPSEGAYPSGLSAISSAALRIYSLSGDRTLLSAAAAAMAPVAALALQRPLGFGASLGVLRGIRSGSRQLVVVSEDRDAPVARAARGWRAAGAVSSVVTTAQAAAWTGAG
ncbi:MAG: uncharacterized protein QOI02_897, partial [Actinomycetota bacterium]|nr:uncharacterized protein [Actinomycetota bacterium]